MRFLDIVGSTYGQLTVIKRVKDARDGHARWRCKCSCGNTVIVASNNLRCGRTKSCGCLHEPHGQNRRGHKTPEYEAWKGAKKRCTNPNTARYDRYGGRGIEMRFKDFQEFFAELGKRPSKNHSVDRINVNGHYEPGNVQWATPKQQANNRAA